MLILCSLGIGTITYTFLRLMHIHLKYNSVYVSIPDSKCPFPHPLLRPPWQPFSSFSKSASLFLFYKFIPIVSF